MKMKRISYLIISLCALMFISCDDGDGHSSFRASSETSGTENGHNYVDLGLPSGTMWATTNVGASNPQDYGNYYAWGEVAPQANNQYKPGSYKYCESNDKGDEIKKITKYNTNDDGIDILEISDDAAYVNWGGKWRMPTYEQQTELLNECYWEYDSNYNGTGVAGCVVFKAKTDADKGFCGINDNMYKSTSASYSLSDSHIFLPSAGLWYDGSFISGGYYWSSSKAKDVLDKNAWNIVMGSSYIFNGLEIRVYGMPVRPVFKP